MSLHVPLHPSNISYCHFSSCALCSALTAYSWYSPSWTWAGSGTSSSFFMPGMRPCTCPITPPAMLCTRRSISFQSNKVNGCLEMNCCQRNLTWVAPAKAAVVCSHLYNAGAARLKVLMRMLRGESSGGDSLRCWREPRARMAAGKNSVNKRLKCFKCLPPVRSFV